MKLNHLGITVTDVQESRAFLEKYFGLKGLGESHRKLTHLRDDNGLILSLFQGSSISPEPETTHIGFIQEDRRAGERNLPAIEGRWVRRTAA